MIEPLLLAINHSFTEPSVWALGAAALWGIISVLLSPCHLGAIPLIVAYINNSQKPDRRRAFLYSLLFGIGLLVMLAVVGLVTSAAGRLLGDIGSGMTIVMGVFLILCALSLMDVPPFSKLFPSSNIQPKRRGAAGALFLGLIYGVVLGPCSFAFLAPMLGFVFAAGSSSIGFGIALMAFYALGHTGTIVAAGTFGDYVGGFLKSKGSGALALWFKRGLGVLVLLAGISQIMNGIQ